MARMVWLVAFVIAAALLAASAVGHAWLLADRRALRRERDRLAGELEASEQQNASLKDQTHQLKREIDVAQQTQRNLQTQIEQAQKQLRESFANLANTALKQSRDDFLEMAKRTFDGEKKDAAHQLEQRKQAIEQLVKPVRETLDKYQHNIQQIEQARKEAYGGLREQLGTLVQDQRRLREETANLKNALRRPEARGRWGEMQLKRVAELAGMIEHCDFEDQITVWKGEAAQRPDMLVKLPGERIIVIDAKTPFDAFINAVEADDEAQREQYLAQHAQQLEAQAQALAKKAYWTHFEQCPDFVIMFIPGESFLQAAVQRKPELLESAMNRSVVIATPTTLISLLKVIALGWREQRVAENARRISDLGKELHERIATATGHVEKLGRNLEQSVKSYNDFIGSFESRVLVSARKFRELGADSPKELPGEGAVEPVETNPRELRASSEE